MISRNYDENLPLVYVDEGHLAQVFMNLVNNAKHALQEQKDNRDKRITIKTTSLADKVEIRLSDNGPGIPQGIIGKIFDPFFTTKDPDKGTGLGLSMVDSFIRGFGGTIRVESAEGNGTTFIITLPAKDIAEPTEGKTGG